MASASDEELEAAFQQHDGDGSGSIDSKELIAVLRDAGMQEVNKAIVAKVLKGYDADESGTLDMDEFKRCVAEIRELQALEESGGGDDEPPEEPAAAPAPSAAAADAIAGSSSSSSTGGAEPPSEDELLLRAFRKYDADGSGTIETKELMSVLEEVGLIMDQNVVSNVLAGYDDDNSGALDMEEFRKVVAELRAYQKEHGGPAAAPTPASAAPADDIDMVFQKFDADKSGTIDPKELTKMLREMGIDADTSAATTVINAFDADKSGGLQLAEFRKLVTEIKAHASGKKDDKAPMPAWLKAISKPVPKNSYLPRFKARKKDDDEKANNFLAYMEKAKKEKAKQEAVEAAKRRERIRAKRGNVQKAEEEETLTAEEQEAIWSLVFTILISVLLALSEAFDMDVLIGFAMMPFISAMKWISKKLDNEELDPTVWASRAGNGAGSFAQHHPAGFVLVDFGLFAIGVVFFLFQADIDKWWAQRNMKKGGYEELDEGKGGGGGAAAKFGGFLSKVADDPEEMQAIVDSANEELEGYDLLIRLRGDMEPEAMEQMQKERARLEGTIKTYKGFLEAMEKKEEEAVDLEEMARLEAEAEAKKKRAGGCADTTKLVVGLIKKAINGIITIWLYFMDLISDYQVTMLFYETGAHRFALVSACLLVGQFVVIWSRCLPYLKMTYGPESMFYNVFLFLGMPFGCFFFDFLMFLMPFGLLPVAPMPSSWRLFIPAYAATRMIAEVLIEALPQFIMQGVIFILVSSNVNAGTAGLVDLTLYTYNGTVDPTLDVNHPEQYAAGSFVSLMPKSILISSLTMLKTWYELVQEAREAGISVAKKGQQLWNVGYGLPLDAIKGNSIYGWKCNYEISDNEVISLVDALGKNESLQRLDLSLAGLEWMPPIKREERSAISTLLPVLQSDPKAMEELEKLIICPSTLWEIPAKNLRSGPEKALKTLQEVPFFSEKGPQRKELHAMFELLCKNRSKEASPQEIELSRAPVTKIFNDAKAKGGKKEVKRQQWQTAVANLMCKGMTRRAHFRIVVGAEVLRGVGFGARELLDLPGGGFQAEELKAGGFEAKELKAAGFKPKELKELGYQPKDMWEAEIPVSEMKALGYTAKELKKGGYTAQEQKDANVFTLAQLKAGGYKAAQLGEVGYRIPDLRAAKFTALDLRKAMLFQPGMMRDAGYTVHEMKSAGYDAKRIHDAGYDAAEATSAGYTVTQMHSAGYTAYALKRAGFTALILREDGYDLNDLQGAGYNADELGDAGYTAQELKEAGTSLVQLKAAGTPMDKLKEAGYTAQRLKQQGYTAAELATGSRGRLDVLSGGNTVTTDEEPPLFYTSKELKVGGITAAELRKGKIFYVIAEFKDGGWSTRELRDAGYSAGELRICGYSAEALHKVGFTTMELITGGYGAKVLRAIGAPAGELRQAGLTARELKEVGYTAKELLHGGFSAKDLISCGFGVGELREAGFNAIQLRALGFTARELKAYGYGAAALKEAGSVVKELKELGFSDEELLEAAFTQRAVDAVNGSIGPVWALKQFGKYEVAELKEYGFVCSDLRGVYTVKNMKDDGFTMDEITASGVPKHAVQAVDGRSTKLLRKAGYPTRILRKVGFELFEMVEGGYTATELKAAHFNALELKEVGFTAGALRVAAFTSRQLHDAGYTLKELYKGNYPWQDLVIFLKYTHAELTQAGYRNLDPKHRLFLEYRPPENDEELGLASPRGQPYSPLSSPRAYPQREDDPRSMRVGDAPLVLRAGHELTSEKLRYVPKGTPVEVLELKQGEGQQMRARIRYEAKGFMWFSEGYKEGWVTSVQADGAHLLVAPATGDLQGSSSPGGFGSGGGGNATFNPSPNILPNPARLPPPAAPAGTSLNARASRSSVSDLYDA